MTGLSTAQLERVLALTVALGLALFYLSGCAPGDWGAYRDQAFWHDRDHVSP